MVMVLSMSVTTVVKHCSYINDVSHGGIWFIAWEAHWNEIWKMKVLLYVEKMAPIIASCYISRRQKDAGLDSIF